MSKNQKKKRRGVQAFVKVTVWYHSSPTSTRPDFIEFDNQTKQAAKSTVLRNHKGRFCSIVSVQGTQPIAVFQ